jgi:hypothetical protein
MLHAINFLGVSAQNKCMKFQRLVHLTVAVRLHIAYTALMGKWGSITKLAKDYGISRTFVYMLKHSLEQMADVVFDVAVPVVGEFVKKKILACILTLRLVGRCSIISISETMKFLDSPKYFSVGAISQVLNYFGSKLQNTLANSSEEVKFIAVAADEIFSHQQPVLISVDPISSAILRMELAESRQAEKWKNHWEVIQENGYRIKYLVNDEGSGMASAQKEILADVIRQPDTYHGIAHNLGLYVDRLEKAAYNAIGYEQERLTALQTGKRNSERMRSRYELAKDTAEEKIELYDNFHYLYLCLIRSLQVFDAKGNPNKRFESEQTLHAALKLLESLKITGLEKEIRSIRNISSQLFAYLDEGENIRRELESFGIPNYILKEFYIAWQCQKNCIKAKRPRRKNYYRMKEKEELELLQYELGSDFYEMKEHVYSQLDRIIQSSAIVENINSIMRMYFNTSKNHVSQNMLNLIMFYHNHRRYIAGKRKEKTPMEILTGQAQKKDWLELLFDKVDWQNALSPDVS